MRHVKRWAKVLATALVVLAAGGFAVSSFLNRSRHVWTNDINYRIIYANEESPTCGLYFSRDGDLLIDLRGKADALYVVNPTTHEIGMPNSSNFYIAFGYAYSKTLVPPTVSMNHSMGKIEVNPEIVVEPYSIEFTSVKNARVHVNWWLNR